MFKGDANYWWDMIKRCHGVKNMAWLNFENLFLDKYFKEALKDAKVEEFLELTQRSPTVAQYEAKFVELSLFISDMVGIELEKCKRFQNVLRLGIREKIIALAFKEYSKMVNRALVAEYEGIHQGSKNQPSLVWLGRVVSTSTLVETSLIPDTDLYLDSTLNLLESDDSVDILS